MAFVYILFLFSVVTVVYLIARQRGQAQSRKWQAQHPDCRPAPHYPHYEPIFGLDMVFKMIRKVGRNEAIAFLQQNHVQYGKTYVTNSFGQRVYYTTDPANFEAVYSTSCTNWGVQPARLDALEPFCGRGFITTDGDAWQQARESIHSAFNKKSADISENFEKALDDTLERLPAHGQTIDLQPTMAHFFHNIAGEFLVGEPFDSPKDSPFWRAYWESISWLQIRVFFGVAGRNIPSASFRRNCKTVHSVIDSYLQRAMRDDDTRTLLQEKEAQQSPTSVIGSLAVATTDRVTFRWQIIQCIMAMQDTTSTLVTNTIFLLSRNPKLWNRLRVETHDIKICSGSARNLNSNKFLQNVLKESLRIYPVFATSGRTSLCDTVLPRGGGPNGDYPIFVPEDSRVITVFHGLHRDPNVFGPNIEEFDPDRWTRIRPSAWEFLPFNNGPRCCEGREMALNQAAFVLGKLAQRYTRLESRDNRAWAGKWGLTVTNANGCKVAMYT